MRCVCGGTTRPNCATLSHTDTHTHTRTHSDTHCTPGPRHAPVPAGEAPLVCETFSRQLMLRKTNEIGARTPGLDEYPNELILVLANGAHAERAGLQRSSTRMAKSHAACGECFFARATEGDTELERKRESGAHDLPVRRTASDCRSASFARPPRPSSLLLTLRYSPDAVSPLFSLLFPLSFVSSPTRFRPSRSNAIYRAASPLFPVWVVGVPVVRAIC